MALPDRNDTTPLRLMEGALNGSPRVAADVRIAGRRQDFDLPIWIDKSGDLRIALPKTNPQHAGDIDQIILSVGDLLSAVGSALENPA